MRHYEIVFLVHPDQSEQVPAMVDRYKSIVTAGGGQVHRHEDWGRRQLTHTIAKLHKAHYVLMNIECDKSALDEILGAFKFNDAVLRHLVIKRDEAVSEPSLLAKPEGSKSDDRPAKPDDKPEKSDDKPAPRAPADVKESAAGAAAPQTDTDESAESPAPDATDSAEAPKVDTAATESAAAAPDDAADAEAKTPEADDASDTDSAADEDERAAQ